MLSKWSRSLGVSKFVKSRKMLPRSGQEQIHGAGRIIPAGPHLTRIIKIAKWKTKNPEKVVLSSLLNRWVMITENNVFGNIWGSYWYDCCSTTKAYCSAGYSPLVKWRFELEVTQLPGFAPAHRSVWAPPSDGCLQYGWNTRLSYDWFCMLRKQGLASCLTLFVVRWISIQTH